MHSVRYESSSKIKSGILSQALVINSPALFRLREQAERGAEDFLLKDNDVCIRGEGDIIDRHYKILQILPTSVEVEDVLNNEQQRILLAQE